MIAIAWFLAGIAAAAATAVVRRAYAARRAPAGATADQQPATPSIAGAPALVQAPAPALAIELADPPTPGLQSPPNVPATTTADSRRLARSLAEELADLASGVEGRAHHLIEAVGDRNGVPRAAEALMTSVQRLRTLHAKLAAFGHVERTRGTGPTAVAPLIASLRSGLQTMQFGLELRWDPPEHLPDIAIPADVAHDALLFLGSALLRAERGATHFAIATETCFAGAEPRLQIELVLEWSSDGHTPTTELLSDPTFALDLEASNQLIVGHGGELTIHHLAGRSVRAVVHWPLAKTVAIETPTTGPVVEPPPVHRPTEHRYGGALVLEADPSVRAMVASELKATGRAVFACADASSACTFLEATPDRFELLIVDHPQRLDGEEALAATIRTVAPTLKIFVMATAPHSTNTTWPHLHHLQKPFGVHELRAALASVLAAG